ncbi:MAG: molybdopterin-binding protein [Hyphomonadaceae bacterium]
MTRTVTAAVMLIGDEILSGRTQDTNLRTIAHFLQPLGVQVREARVVPDVRETIIATVNELRARFDYVFTTGGIGPTHDDITADSMAAAFGDTIDVREDARAALLAHYPQRGLELTEGRLRMARIPASATLIANPVSGAPGFQIGNVFVMAGVPSVMRGMLQDIGHRIEGGAVIHARTVRAKGLREGDLSQPLRDLSETHAAVSLGSYPWMRTDAEGRPDYGVALVARSADAAALDAAASALAELVRAQGQTPEIDPVD